jgi:hypothetical protein
MTRHNARQLLLADIKIIIETASASGGMLLRTSCYAEALARKHPEFSLGRIIDEMTIAAISAGLAVEISRPRKFSPIATQNEEPVRTKQPLVSLPRLLPNIRSPRDIFAGGGVAFSRNLLLRGWRAATSAQRGHHRPS